MADLSILVVVIPVPSSYISRHVQERALQDQLRAELSRAKDTEARLRGELEARRDFFIIRDSASRLRREVSDLREQLRHEVDALGREVRRSHSVSWPST